MGKNEICWNQELLCADDCNRHFELLKRFDEGSDDFRDTEYYQFNRGNGKSHKSVTEKIEQFRKLYKSIKKKGYRYKHGYIVLSDGGARLDGSHRSSIVEHLGYEELEVIIVRWKDVFGKKKDSSFDKHLKSQQKKYKVFN